MRIPRGAASLLLEASWLVSQPSLLRNLPSTPPEQEHWQSRDAIPLNGSCIVCRKGLKVLNVAFETPLSGHHLQVLPFHLWWEMGGQEEKEAWSCHSGQHASLSLRDLPSDQEMVPTAEQQARCMGLVSGGGQGRYGKETGEHSGIAYTILEEVLFSSGLERNFAQI